MGKFSSLLYACLLIAACGVLPSCGGGKPTTVAPEVTPTSVTVTPSPVVSLEVGGTEKFTATPAADRFTFQSSNPTVLTIANNGEACAGSWNSLTNPQVCTPGQPGTAQVTASTLGVSSTPVMVYVHAPITSVAISKVPGQQTLSDSCLSKGTAHGPESWVVQANAFNGSTDITPTVGPFAWQQINPAVGTSASIVSLTALPTGTTGCLLSPGGQCLNQEKVTASVPGITQVYATASGFSSQPIPIETCRVAQVSIAAAGGQPSQTSFLVNTGAATVLNATVIDTVGQAVTGVPLTWSTSNPASLTATPGSGSTVYGSVGTITSSTPGEGTVIASCTPPSCNAGIKPSLPIYPQAAFNFDVEPSNSATPANPIAYATTTACTDKFANPALASCTPTLVPITKGSTNGSFAAGTPIPLPAPPDSLVFDSRGTNAYLGVDSSKFGQQGAMVFSGSTVTQVTNAPGKPLAISPDGNTAIVAHTAESTDLTNQVFICSNCSGTARTVTSFVTAEPATAAAFSPDNLKAYIVAGSTLYVYSKVDPLQTIPLTGTANNAVFHPEGGFAYLAGPGAAISPYRTCDNLQLSSANLPTANPPLMIRALPDGSTLLALEPPNIDVISTTLSFTPTGLCTTTVSDTINSINLGQSSFIPTQFFVSPNGQTAFILAETAAGPPPTRLPFIIAFNVAAQTTSLLSLANSAVPLSASLAATGNLLFVGANDGAVHILDTATGLDTQQVTFPFPTNELCFGPGNPATQVALSQVTITAATQNGSNTTYSYKLIAGPALSVGESITVSHMGETGNDGTFTISSLGTSGSGLTFTAANPNGVSATGQSGLGTVPIPCNPDLVAVRP